MISQHIDHHSITHTVTVTHVNSALFFKMQIYKKEKRKKKGWGGSTQTRQKTKGYR